eukprot:gene54959-73419_t
MALLLIFHAQLWTGRGSIPNVNDLQQRLTDQEAKNAKAQAGNDQLAAEVRDLKEGLEMVEEKARFELGMIKSDEALMLATLWAALLARLDQRPGVATGFIAQSLPLDDPATLALAHLCAEQDRLLHRGPSMIRRAPIAGQPGSPRATHLFERRLEQLEARLAARLGPVRLVLHSRAGDCEPWLAAFFALERGAAIASPAPEALRS